MILIRRLRNNKNPVTFFKKIIEVLSRRIFIYLITRRKWKIAIIVGEKLINKFPDNSYYHLKLAECYKGINENFHANTIIEKGMKLNFNLNDMIQKIEGLLEQGTSIESHYVLLGGWNNAGCIIHRPKHGRKNFFTKISFKSSMEKEKQFYLKIYKNNPKLESITPRFVNLIEIVDANVSLITMEKVEGKMPNINEKLIEDVISINKKVTSIRFSQVSDGFNNSIDIKMENDFDLLRSFALIHKKSTNKFIFNYIHKRMVELNYSQQSLYLIKRIEEIIIGNKMYNIIKPEEHYSLQHGDYFHHNLIKEEKNGRVFIIDWGYMSVGPTCTDMAGFLGRLELPFNYVNTVYLSSNNASGHLKPIEKLFFIYALIVTWILVLTREKFDTEIEIYLKPAIENLEFLKSQVISNNI